MLYIGIDVARSKHDFFIMGENGKRVAGPITIRNNLDGFTRLIRVIQECKNAQEDILGDVFIGMESTGHYGDNILNYLYEKGFTIYVMNPKLTSDIRKSTSLRKTKTDKIDSRAIANIVRTHREEFEPFTIKSYHISELKSLTRYRQSLVSDRSRLKNSVKRLIIILFPEYDEIFSDIHGETSYAILTEFPGSIELAKANIIKLTNIISKASNNRYKREMAERIRNVARNSIGTTSKVKSEELRDTIERIRQLSAKISELDKRIDEMMKEVDSPISTIPGVGKVLAAIIISETGNIARFKNSDKLVAYAGISPTIYQSGQYIAPIAKMEKRGSRQLRYAIMLAAEQVARNCQYFAAQMQKKRAEGKSYRVAISHIARNLIRLIYRMELTGETYHAPSLA
ncbi:MAG: IS110 family transposase [Candidatus Saccharibacteria bacterium]|nr:IS110 family transposase [Candidatus Saccharibacteria bacterium]